MRDLSNGRVELVLGNIIDQKVDAIVNAAIPSSREAEESMERFTELRTNSKRTLHGIARKRSRSALRDRRRSNNEGREPECKIRHSCGWSVLQCKVRRKIASAASSGVHSSVERSDQASMCLSCFPAFSTGAYRFPIIDAASTSIDAVCGFLDSHKGIDLVRFVLFKTIARRCVQDALTAWTSTGGRGGT